MIGAADIFWGGVVPAAVAAIVMAVVWQLTGRAASAWRTALVVGYVAGHWALDARNVGIVPAMVKSYRVTEVRDWLPLLALLAIVPDAFSCVGKWGPWLGGLLRVALCLFVPWRLVRGTAYWPAMTLPDFGFDTAAWSTGEAVTWIGGIAVSGLIAWLFQRAVDKHRDRLARSVLASLVALGGAITMALSASLIYGQLLGVLTAALAGCGVASALIRTGRGPEAAAGPVVIIFGSLLVLGYFFAELRPGNAVLLLLAMTVAIGWLPLPAKWSPRWQVACRSLVCLGVLGTALTLAGFDFAATQAPSERSPDEYNPYETGPP